MNTAIAPVIELTLLLRIGYSVLPCTSLQCDLTPVIIRQQFVWLKTTTYEWGFEKLCWKFSDLLKSWKLQNKDVLAMIIQNNSNSKLCPYSFHHHAINLTINNVNNLTWYHLVLHMCKRIGLWTCRNCWRACTLTELALLKKIHLQLRHSSHLILAQWMTGLTESGVFIKIILETFTMWI